MKDLIEKLEAAEAPSNWLNRMIVISALGWHAEIVNAESCAPCVVWHTPDGAQFPDADTVPDFTGSIDAALRLVPPDHSWWVAFPGYDHGVYQDGKTMAEIHSPLSSGGGPKWTAFGRGHAIAICIAGLRARLALARD